MLQRGGEDLEEGVEEGIVGLIYEAKGLEWKGWKDLKSLEMLAYGVDLEGERDEGVGQRTGIGWRAKRREGRERRPRVVLVPYDPLTSRELKVRDVRVACEARQKQRDLGEGCGGPKREVQESWNEAQEVKVSRVEGDEEMAQIRSGLQETEDGRWCRAAVVAALHIGARRANDQPLNPSSLPIFLEVPRQFLTSPAAPRRHLGDVVRERHVPRDAHFPEALARPVGLLGVFPLIRPELELENVLSDLKDELGREGGDQGGLLSAATRRGEGGVLEYELEAVHVGRRGRRGHLEG